MPLSGASVTTVHAGEGSIREEDRTGEFGIPQSYPVAWQIARKIAETSEG
jgi:hypothetical protein